jgi:hypothetical protein
MAFYHRHLKGLHFDPRVFEPILNFAVHSHQWRPGIDVNGTYWNVKELPVHPSEFPILKEIETGLQAEFKRTSFFVSQVLPGGLANHVDNRKWGNLAFPLRGPFESSPTLFLDQFNHVVESFTFEKNILGAYTPVIFNTRMCHSVVLAREQTAPRLVLMMDLFDWPDHLIDKVDQHQIWNDTPQFRYEVK